MAGKNNDKQPWNKMDKNANRNMTGSGRRTYADRFEEERAPREKKSGYRQNDSRRPADDRRPAGGYRPADERRPMSNPPRTGGYRAVPKAVFDANGSDMPQKAVKQPEATYAEPPKDPVLRNAAARAARGPMNDRFDERELPENLLVGRNPIREAIKTGHAIEKLLVAKGDLSGAARDIVRMALDRGVVVQEVDRSRLDAIYPTHQGMLAYISMAEYSTIDAMFEKAEAAGEEPFLIILDGITDPHNLGAIIRSAECAGAHGVILPERRAAGLGPAAAKATAGALNHMRIARVKNLNRTIDELKERNVWVIGTAMDGENALTADLTGPVALVIGSEGDGISHLTLEKCDRTLTLPMKGQIQSLNASVAAGVLLYEVVRARAK